MSKAGAVDMALELLLQMIVIEEGRGNYESAARLFREAEETARHSTDQVLRLRVTVTGLRILRKREPGGSPDQDRLRRQALAALTRRRPARRQRAAGATPRGGGGTGRGRPADRRGGG